MNPTGGPNAAMSRGRTPLRRRAAVAAACCAAAVLATAAPPADDAAPADDLRAALGAWQSELAKVTTISSDFVQDKRMALFREPLRITGRMFIETGGRFAWETLAPVRYKMVVADGRIRQWDEETGRVQTISMRDNPAAAAIHEQMSAWFSGRYAALTNTYAATLASKEPVSFLFKPRAASPASAYLASVQVWLRADGRHLDRVLIQERSGDSTEIVYTNTVVNQTIPAEAWNVRALTATNSAPASGGGRPGR
jgi:outer membrane lipoprotein-sorting protein